MSKEFIDEVNQDIQDERLLTFWNKFKYIIIGGAVSLVLGVGGYSWMQTAEQNRLERQNVALDTAIGNVESLNTLIADSADGVRLLAVLDTAKVLVANNKYADAISALEQYANTTENTIHAQYAMLSSIWIGMRTGAINDVHPILEKIASSGTFSTLAELTRVDIFLGKGDVESARKILQSILDTTDIDQEYKVFAQAVLQGL